MWVLKWKEYQCNLFKLFKTDFGSTQSKVRAKRGQRSYLQGYQRMRNNFIQFYVMCRTVSKQRAQ